MTPRKHDTQTAAETFGLPPATPHLIAKLRNMDPDLLKTIRPPGGQDLESAGQRSQVSA